MTLSSSSSSSLYTMLYDMRPIISPQSDCDKSSPPKRRSIFTVSSNNGSSSKVTISSTSASNLTTTTTGTSDRQELMNITEHLTTAMKNDDHRYSSVKDDDEDNNNSNEYKNNKLTHVSNQNNLDSASYLSSSSSSTQNNLEEVDNLSQSFNSNNNCCCPQSPKSGQNNKSNSCLSSSASSDAVLNGGPLSTSMMKTDTSRQQQQQKLERHNSLNDLILHRPKNHHRSSKGSRPPRNKEIKSNPEKTMIKGNVDVGGDDNTSSNKSDDKITSKPTVNNSMEFCDETTTTTNLNLSSKDQERKDTIQKSVMYKASTAFAMGAVRKLSLKVSKVEQDLQRKTEESAARFILHRFSLYNSLLLNSWRQSRKQNEKLANENNHYQRTVENMCLQLRVIRQMHRDEKEKSSSRSLEINGQAIQITNLKKERDNIQSELEKVENELNNCQVFVDTLRNQNMEMIMAKTELHNVIGRVESEKQDEINKRIKTESEIQKNQQVIKELREQVHDVTCQKIKWQEEARGQESMVISLKTDVAHSDKKLVQVQNAYNELQREVKLFKEYKQTMQVDSQRLKEQLKESLEHAEQISENMQTVQDVLEREKTLTADMKRLIEEKESQVTESRQDLSLFLKACVDKRRRLANSFHYLVFPLDLFRLIFDSQRDQQQYKNRVTLNDNDNLIF